MMLESNNETSIGIVVSNAYSSFLGLGNNTISYWVYDLFVGNELVSNVPQNFMIRIKTDEDEENSQ